MKIAVTDTMGSEDKFRKYIDWIAAKDPEVKRVVLSYTLDNLKALDECDALLLTGGNDVDPALYGGPSGHPAISDVDRKRDDFESKALDKAMREGLPVLGICRGLQLANVYFGGTLIPDIEEAGFRNHQRGEGGKGNHEVIVEQESLLSDIVGRNSGVVNSSHHQAVLTPGSGLKVSSRSTDGIIESLERDRPDDYPFFLLVQWHPERMIDGVKNPFSGKIRDKFFAAVQYSEKHSQ